MVDGDEEDTNEEAASWTSSSQEDLDGELELEEEEEVNNDNDDDNIDHYYSPNFYVHTDNDNDSDSDDDDVIVDTPFVCQFGECSVEAPFAAFAAVDPLLLAFITSCKISDEQDVPNYSIPRLILMQNTLAILYNMWTVSDEYRNETPHLSEDERKSQSFSDALEAMRAAQLSSAISHSPRTASLQLSQLDESVPPLTKAQEVQLLEFQIQQLESKREKEQELSNAINQNSQTLLSSNSNQSPEEAIYIKSYTVQENVQFASQESSEFYPRASAPNISPFGSQQLAEVVQSNLSANTNESKSLFIPPRSHRSRVLPVPDFSNNHNPAKSSENEQPPQSLSSSNENSRDNGREMHPVAVDGVASPASPTKSKSSSRSASLSRPNTPTPEPPNEAEDSRVQSKALVADSSVLTDFSVAATIRPQLKKLEDFIQDTLPPTISNAIIQPRTYSASLPKQIESTQLAITSTSNITIQPRVSSSIKKEEIFAQATIQIIPASITPEIVIRPRTFSKKASQIIQKSENYIITTVPVPKSKNKGDQRTQPISTQAKIDIKAGPTCSSSLVNNNNTKPDLIAPMPLAKASVPTSPQHLSLPIMGSSPVSILFPSLAKNGIPPSLFSLLESLRREEDEERQTLKLQTRKKSAQFDIIMPSPATNGHSSTAAALLYDSPTIQPAKRRPSQLSIRSSNGTPMTPSYMKRQSIRNKPLPPPPPASASQLATGNEIGLSVSATGTVRRDVGNKKQTMRRPSLSISITGIERIIFASEDDDLFDNGSAGVVKKKSGESNLIHSGGNVETWADSVLNMFAEREQKLNGERRASGGKEKIFDGSGDVDSVKRLSIGSMKSVRSAGSGGDRRIKKVVNRLSDSDKLPMVVPLPSQLEGGKKKLTADASTEFNQIWSNVVNADSKTIIPKRSSSRIAKAVDIEAVMAQYDMILKHEGRQKLK
ncbi:hypothetical protein HK100_011444 [Physocladia obscura]|uniref:Uncharacterized protein n=1 Tax=Physocladia obscura TaxID=109957 RepID=A0AAD5T3S3_9FUNG|nr:hypothetical protein HK100_011444 [Physocladia obscura]